MCEYMCRIWVGPELEYYRRNIPRDEFSAVRKEYIEAYGQENIGSVCAQVCPEPEEPPEVW